VKNKPTPPMTADKAHWTAVATAATTVIFYASGVGGIDIEGFSESLTELFTLTAAIVVQAAVTWATAYYKRNHLK